MAGARAKLVSGRVVFGSAADFEEEVELFLSRGALLLAGAALPPLLEAFDFVLVTPGTDVAMRGRLVAFAEGGAVVEIVGFSEELLQRIRGRHARAGTDPPRRGDTLPRLS